MDDHRAAEPAIESAASRQENADRRRPCTTPLASGEAAALFSLLRDVVRVDSAAVRLRMRALIGGPPSANTAFYSPAGYFEADRFCSAPRKATVSRWNCSVDSGGARHPPRRRRPRRTVAELLGCRSGHPPGTPTASQNRSRRSEPPINPARDSLPPRAWRTGDAGAQLLPSQRLTVILGRSRGCAFPGFLSDGVG